MKSMVRARSSRCCVWITLTLLCLSALLPSPAWATTYYVDANNPSARDTNPGTASQPFKTIGKATPLLRAGDTLLVKAGIYRELVILSKSGTATEPITIAAFPRDEGKAIINAAERVTRWRKCTGPDDCSGNPNWSHIYWADVAGAVAAHPDENFAIRQVFQHGQPLPRSRYPDTGWSYPTSIVDPATTFGDSTLSLSRAHFNGAVCHIKTAVWQIDQIPIADSYGSTIVLAKKPRYDLSTRFGYYVTSIVGEINEEGEWAYDPARKRLYLWPKGDVPEEVEFTYREYCVRTYDGASFHVVRGFTMRHPYQYGIWLYRANNMTIENNTIERSYTFGIHLQSTGGSCDNNHILRNTIKYSVYRGINTGAEAAYANVEGNYVYATGVERFGEDLLHGRGEGIYISGPYTRVYNNRIDRTACTGIYVSGKTLSRDISYNYVTNSELALSDGGGIYTAGYSDVPEKDHIHHNIFVDTIGCNTMNKYRDMGEPVTIDRYSGGSPGIYVDEEGSRRVIEHNTVINSHYAGIFFHGASDNLVEKNTLYGNGEMQVLLVGRTRGRMQLVDDVMRDNILFATDAQQRTLFLGVYYDDVHFGQSDGNYFYNPYANAHIRVERYVAGQVPWTLSLDGWHALSGYDGNSQEFSYLSWLPEVTLASPTQSKIVYNASLDVNTIDLGPGFYCDVEGNGIRGTLTLQPFQSKILISAVAAVVSYEAANPVPPDGGQVEGLPMLAWTPAGGAAFHDLYLGTEKDAVEAADATSPLYRGRQTGISFSLAGLVQPGGRYFWRIDEVEADGTTIHKGIVWTFTMSGLLVIDDLENYTDEEGSRIEETWLDGSVNGTGSQVGHRGNPSTPGTGDDHGKWSMLLAYDNARSPFVSEVGRVFADEQDWTAGEMDTLSLWFQGEAASFAETAPGTFTMSAAGADIWYARDEFRYAYQRLDGDGAMIVRVDSVLRTDQWAKAGVMIRESLSPGSRFAGVYATPGKGVRFQARSLDGGLAASDTNVATAEQTALQTPVWVKLERAGTTVNAYYSRDGANWTSMSWNPQTTNMSAKVYIGLALTSHAPGTTTVATFSGVQITGRVTGPWQVADVGVDHRGNAPDDLYVTVGDGDGKMAMVVHPDPAAVNVMAWTQWTVPLTDFIGVDLSRVRRMSIGVGSLGTGAATGDGRIYVDDIQVGAKDAIAGLPWGPTTNGH